MLESRPVQAYPAHGIITLCVRKTLNVGWQRYLWRFMGQLHWPCGSKHCPLAIQLCIGVHQPVTLELPGQLIRAAGVFRLSRKSGAIHCFQRGESHEKIIYQAPD
jgi:hypothetical protein